MSELSNLTNKYKLKRTQFFDNQMQIWYIYSGGVLERIHYNKKPAANIDIIKERPDYKVLADGRKKPVNYLNNADFLCWWQESYDSDTITQEFSDALVLLIYRISLKSWRNYTWIEEWRQQCYLVAITRYRKFDPAKSTACFAYFSSLVNNAMIDCLRSERKQRRVKDHLAVAAGLDPSWNYEE